MIKTLIILLLASALVFAEDKRSNRRQYPLQIMNTYPDRAAKIGDYAFPTNPANDRAAGYLLQGKVRSRIGNYGGFIDGDNHPAAFWGGFTYLPNVSFLAGVPGHKYSSAFDWSIYESVSEGNTILRQTWVSTDAYTAWFPNGDTNFVSVLFEAENDDGIWRVDSVSKKLSIDMVDNHYQWGIDETNERIFISALGTTDPNTPGARIGLIYPWAIRPALKERTDDFDVYEYGEDREEWTADDIYRYYGANVAESWLTRIDGKSNTDWQAATKSRANTHDVEVTAGDIFGNTPWTDPNDTYPLLAHSNFSQTWPQRVNVETGELEKFWPGWWAEEYDETLPNCSGTRKDPDCWREVPGRFISDSDVYMEFDDRWAHRANLVNTNDEYEVTGYPMGLKVQAEAHSYGVAYAEDIMFVTVRVRNESGDWFDEDGNFHDGMIMPDGTKLNRGKGFNYQDISLGFYMDGDAVWADINGNNWPHSNDDDFMEYYDERFEIGGDSLIVSMAMIYDYDGLSAGAEEQSLLGIVATQLLDTPKATHEIDLDLDGFPDRYPGEDLKMTDWHWFDWYNRPGVVARESNSSGCYAGDAGCPQAKNKEEIMYKLMVGDTTNLKRNEHVWFFHTKYPGTDDPSDLNPHFDSLKGLAEDFPDGLDCVFIMSCGPFDLKVGEEVPFSFCIIFGQNKEDLIKNGQFAQIMYNSHYQGYTPPIRPEVHAVADHGKVTLYWDDAAEQTIDIVTGYADFEGYKIYKSINGGSTWGTPDKQIFDDEGIAVGWQPIAQYDLSADDDSVHCIDKNDECSDGENRGRSISGPDPHAPWFNLGTDTGLDAIRTDTTINEITYHYSFTDREVQDGIQYTYAVTAYDMGVEADFTIVWRDTIGGSVPDTIWSKANPDHWSSPDGYANIENSRGTTILDKNFVKVYPGYKAQEEMTKVGVVPNPYIVHSGLNETEHFRKIHFTKLPSVCTITIYTVSGELVQTLVHEDLTSQNSNEIRSGGEAEWDLRTVNNQEVAPGLYVFTVEADGMKNYIGKFAVVR